MTLEALWGSYVFIIGGLGGVSTLLSSALNDEAQRQLSSWLKAQAGREPRSFVHAANQAFLFTFDWLFASRQTAFEGALWFALMISPLLLILARLAFLVEGVDVGDATDLLSLALWLTCALAVFLVTIYLETTTGAVAGIAIFVAVIVLGYLSLGGLGSLLVSLTIGFFFGTLVGAVVSRGALDIGLALAFAGSVFVTIGGLLVIALEALTGIGSHSVGFGILGMGMGMFVGGGQILGPHLAAAGSPVRTFVYSLFFIGLVGLLRVDAASAFFADFRAQGPRLLVFVAFTVFADGVSMLETRWILRKAVNARPRSVLVLLGLDLGLSAAIFLFLPLVLGEIPEFLRAVLFRGERPWLGILFWSSFSTSAIFYVFVLSSMLIRPLSHVPKLARYLAIDTKPVLVLTIALGAAITVIYVVGAGAAAVALALRGGLGTAG